MTTHDDVLYALRRLATPALAATSHPYVQAFPLVDAYARAGARGRPVGASEGRIVARYLAGRAHLDNGDLVDTSAWQILGSYLRAGGVPDVPADLRETSVPACATHDRTASLPAVLAALLAAPRSWDRRIAVVARFAWTRGGEAGPALAVAAQLHDDGEDLVLKSVGWQLRAVGQRCGRALLDTSPERHATNMGRVAGHDRASRRGWGRGAGRPP